MSRLQKPEYSPHLLDRYTCAPYNLGMQIQLKATGIELTPAIKDYAEKKISSLEKFFGESEGILAAVEVGKTTAHHRSGDVYRAEVSIRVSGVNHYAAAEKDDLYAAIDEVKDEVAREIVKAKGRKQTLIRRGGAKIKNLLRRLGRRNKNL
jgi:putative sigma-54 modulation protein